MTSFEQDALYKKDIYLAKRRFFNRILINIICFGGACLSLGFFIYSAASAHSASAPILFLGIAAVGVDALTIFMALKSIIRNIDHFFLEVEIALLESVRRQLMR